VIAASYEAKAKGVRTGMPRREARILAPDAHEEPADFLEASKASEEIEAVLHEQCMVVQQYSIDEWFIDMRSVVGGLPTDLASWAQTMRSSIGRRTGLPVSVGIAQTKILAKMAGDASKPGGVRVLPHDDHVALQAFLECRPVAAIPGIGRRRHIVAQDHQWFTAWDFRAASDSVVTRIFGKSGRDLQRELKGEMTDPVSSHEPPPKSVSRCRTFSITRSKDLLCAHLFEHVVVTVARMRAHGLSAKRMGMWLRSYERSLSTDRASAVPLDVEETILTEARAMLDAVFDPRLSYFQVGFVLSDLRPASRHQYSLFEKPEHDDRTVALQHSLDAIRSCYGRDVIRPGSSSILLKRRKVLGAY
jgi:nucleotidyltransferase/DNA polymerase involved in DNA repair